jgi:hypothetical protein
MTIVCGLIGTLTAPGIVPRAALERLLDVVPVTRNASEAA